MITKQKKFKIFAGLILIGMGGAMIIPPPDIEIFFITGLVVAGIPLRYSIPIVYLGGFLMILSGSWLTGKNVRDILKIRKIKKEGKNEETRKNKKSS